MKHHKGKREKQRKRQKAKEMEVIIFDASYIPERPAAGKGRTFGASFLMLFAVAGILTGSFLSSFQVHTVWYLLLLGIVVACLLFTGFFLEEKLDGKRVLIGLFLVALYGAVCFVFQRQIQDGFFQTANSVIRRINQTYDGNIRTFGVGQGTEGTVFLFAVLFPLTGVLGAGLVRGQKLLVVAAVLFPVLAMTAVAGGSPAEVWLFLLTVSLVVLAASARSRIRGMSVALAAGVLVLAVSVPAWYVVRPLLDVPAASAAKAGTKIQMRLMQSLWKFLPEISGGNLNLSLEGVGGGVEDGTLGAVDGYYFTGVEALRVTSAQKPQETVYLKGFVGETYTGDSFEAGNEKNFVNAAASWKTEGNSALYIQNLPFLRMMYYENFSGENAPDETRELTTSANTITVENLNANTAYTYVPYQAFLNDHYDIYGGDGYVGGQTVQEDIFSCYWRSDYKEMMESFRDGENNEGLLNSVEDSYQAYCNQHDRELPEDGLERLKKECRKKAKEEKWNLGETVSQRPDWDRADEIEEIRQYVVKTLLEKCKYELDVDALPDGEDFVERFLYETKEGYSMHFAAAATVMFRELGVPARYVVGYAAPKELFVGNADGTYTAVLEDDNAHAWTEIYEPFIGWVPVEVTPGMEAEVTDSADEDNPETNGDAAPAAEKKKDDDSGEPGWTFKIPDWLSGNLETVMAAVQIILALGIAAALVYKLVSRRRRRLGIGRTCEEQIKALYHSLFCMLVLSGMQEECILDSFRNVYISKKSAGEDVGKAAIDKAAISIEDIDKEQSYSLNSYLASSCPNLTAEDIGRMENLILQTYYSSRIPDAQEAAWMRSIYKNAYCSLKKKMSLKKRIGFLFWGS
ncbi:MAG: transglutaminase domain-containing protein [Eubacteriales bacterium]|nr:transglutaminase domain-containing protein [Eubacteriales bacterium]